MKTTLTLLLLCFCTSLFAQEDIETTKDEISNLTPFIWHQKQEEIKNAILLEKKHQKEMSDIRVSIKNKKNIKLPIILKIPDYKGPKGLSLMPDLPIDTTNTHYYKIYPRNEKLDYFQIK
ncbi:hypothetical protein [uncultured Dokdonia sp.]|uniref:hypothetical protein n=1 Tax=uncultured Dokdonia sp. TaxID=575653 RepID=UPI0026312E12|nr:hypothetical protein [uncultured Dokdonia sp.]